MRYFGIPQNRILAAEAAVENGAGVGTIGGTITDRLIRVPSGAGKPEAIRSVLKSPIVRLATRFGIARCSPCPTTHSRSIQIRI